MACLSRESGAIILYLVEQYDTQHKISFSSPSEKAVMTQWIFFQASGQGYITTILVSKTFPTHLCRVSPYFGQASWFLYFHPEKYPSAIERYQNESRRILGVLEFVLSKQDWLVGGKLSVADMAFVPFNNVNVLKRVLGDDFDFGKEFPKAFA